MYIYILYVYTYTYIYIHLYECAWSQTRIYNWPSTNVHGLKHEYVIGVATGNIQQYRRNTYIFMHTYAYTSK